MSPFIRGSLTGGPSRGSSLFEQFVRVPRGNSQIRSAKALNQGKVYSDHFSLWIKKRPTRTTECCRGVVNDLIPKHVANMALGSGWPNELLRSHPQQDLANVLSAAGNFVCNLRARPGKNACLQRRQGSQSGRRLPPSRWLRFDHQA